jgi:hypothetical protein
VRFRFLRMNDVLRRDQHQGGQERRAGTRLHCQ